MKYEPKNFSDLANTKLGENLWKFLTNDNHRLMMVTASKLRRPAVEAISDELLTEFGDAIRTDRTKQMIGHMVRQIMENEGWFLDASHVPVRVGDLFNKASRYTTR